MFFAGLDGLDQTSLRDVDVSDALAGTFTTPPEVDIVFRPSTNRDEKVLSWLLSAKQESLRLSPRRQPVARRPVEGRGLGSGDGTEIESETPPGSSPRGRPDAGEIGRPPNVDHVSTPTRLPPCHAL